MSAEPMYDASRLSSNWPDDTIDWIMRQYDVPIEVLEYWDAEGFGPVSFEDCFIGASPAPLVGLPNDDGWMHVRHLNTYYYFNIA